MSCRKNQLCYPLESELFYFSQESGLNSSFKFLRSRKEPTRVSGFVLILLGARAMKTKNMEIAKLWATPVNGVLQGRGPVRDY